MKKDFYLRVIEQCIAYGEPFTQEQLSDDLQVPEEGYERNLLRKFFQSADKGANYDTMPNETIFCLVGQTKKGEKKALYLLTVEARFKYLDYMELQEARKNAKRAFYMAMFAATISLGGIIAQFFLPQ